MNRNEFILTTILIFIILAIVSVVYIVSQSETEVIEEEVLCKNTRGQKIKDSVCIEEHQKTTFPEGRPDIAIGLLIGSVIIIMGLNLLYWGLCNDE